MRYVVQEDAAALPSGSIAWCAAVANGLGRAVCSSRPSGLADRGDAVWAARGRGRSGHRAEPRCAAAQSEGGSSRVSNIHQFSNRSSASGQGIVSITQRAY